MSSTKKASVPFLFTSATHGFRAPGSRCTSVSHPSIFPLGSSVDKHSNTDRGVPTKELACSMAVTELTFVHDERVCQRGATGGHTDRQAGGQTGSDRGGRCLAFGHGGGWRLWAMGCGLWVVGCGLPIVECGMRTRSCKIDSHMASCAGTESGAEFSNYSGRSL